MSALQKRENEGTMKKSWQQQVRWRGQTRPAASVLHDSRPINASAETSPRVRDRRRHDNRRRGELPSLGVPASRPRGPRAERSRRLPGARTYIPRGCLFDAGRVQSRTCSAGAHSLRSRESQSPSPPPGRTMNARSKCHLTEGWCTSK